MFSLKQLTAKSAGLLVAVAALGFMLPGKSAFAQSFSMICMPDPQYYTTSDHPSEFNLYSKQSQWVVDNEAAFNIKHVIWLGDLTNDNTLAQWQTASSAYLILDNANISYGVVPGNHDYKVSGHWTGANYRDLLKFNGTLGPQRFAGKSWYGGNMGETTNHNENNYTFFSAAGMDFLVVGLEYCPRKEALTWANNLISSYPNHRVIIFTHAYLTHDGNYTGGSGTATGTVGSHGSELFDECASRHSNVFMVVCGHVGDTELNVKHGVAGNTIYEMLVDYQFERIKGTEGYLGNGWLRKLQFVPAANKIYATTIAVDPGNPDIFNNGVTELYLSPYPSDPTASDHKFTLDYDMTSPMEPYTYLNSSVAFEEMGVGEDLYSNQQAPDVDEAENGDWAIAWANDPEIDGVFDIQVEGFDSDGNVRFPKSTVNTSAVNITSATKARVAMAPDGRFVVTWLRGSNAIIARSYNANGTPAGPEITVTSVSGAGTVDDPDIDIDDLGNYVVAWTDDRDGNGVHQINARGFTFVGTERFTRKTVNVTDTGQQLKPKIAMTGNGNYVVAWQDDKDGTWDVNMRGYNANETELFAQAAANATLTGVQQEPAIGINDAGNFVVVWEDDADLNGAYQIKARGFEANGTEKFSERTVNIDSAGNQLNPEVAMDPSGNWYPVWEDNGVSGTGYQIVSNVFSAAGARVNASDIRVNVAKSVNNKFSDPVRKDPVVTVHKSGRYIVSWGDDMDGSHSFQALARGMGGFATSLAVRSVHGTVAKSPEQPFYAPGSVVSVTATPGPGRTFIKWTGDVPAGSQTSNPLNITMDASKVITAEYSASSAVPDWQLY